VNWSGFDGRPSVSADGLIMVFDRNHDRTVNTLFMATRANQNEAFGTPLNLGISGASPSISADGLMLFYMGFDAEPPDCDIFVTTRPTRDASFGPPQLLGPEVNSEMCECDPDISYDGSTLHFVRTDIFRIPGNIDGSFLKYADLWEVAIISQLAGDYNADGVVDAADYVVWRHGLGTTYTQADYDVWRAHFGQSAGSGAAGYPLGASPAPLSAEVPEPAVVLIILTAMSPILSRRTPGMYARAENERLHHSKKLF
jgi:hypothetical protein